MKPEQENKKNLDVDLKTFEELPSKTQELLLLGNDAEKASGQVGADIDSKIMTRSGLAKK